MRLSHVIFFSAVVLITALPLPAGEFGSTVQLFPQFGIGGIAESHFTVRSAGEALITVDVELRLSDGSLFLEDSIEVPAGRTVTVVYSDPAGEVRNGWARLSSSGQFTASLFYRITGVGNVGVLPSTPAKHLQLFSFVEDTDTGLAWANPDPANQSELMVRVLDGEGQLQREVETTLEALGHDAFFLTEDPYLADSNGAVEIWADRPIIAVSLRTDDSLLAGVPVIGAQGNGLDPGSVTTEHLADGAVTGQKIADGAVVRSLNGLTDDIALVAGANLEIQVNSNELTVSAVGGGGTITGVNAGSGLTGGGSVGNVMLAVANAGITSGHLADDSVGLSELAPAVSVGRVQPGNGESNDSPNLILGFPGNSIPAGTNGATIGGGGLPDFPNIAGPGQVSTVGGGFGNTASGSPSTVGGGGRNIASSGYSTVAGGHRNTASSGRGSTVGGGDTNTASAIFASVGGGVNNTASGAWSTVPGGRQNAAQGEGSFAAGDEARALHDHTFVWSDGTTFSSTGDNQFLIEASGGVGINSNTPGGLNTVDVRGKRIRLLDTSTTKELLMRVDGGQVDVTAQNADLVLSANGGTTVVLGSVGIDTHSPQGKLDVNGRIVQRGRRLHADYVFEDDYELESIEEHAEFMWGEKHLPAVAPAHKSEDGHDIVEYGSRMRGILEELEKAHIYIEQLHERNKSLAAQLHQVQEMVATWGEGPGH